MSRLEGALVAVAQFLAQQQVPYMVIGGIANVLWGIPRTTLDVDLTIWVAEDRLERFAQLFAQTFSSRVKNPVAFVKETRVLPLTTTDGVHVDLIFGQLPYEREAIERAVWQEIQGVRVRVCRPEDLVLHKLASERSKDREDVQGILRQQAGRLDRAYLDARVAALAHALGRPDLQAWYDQCLREGRPDEEGLGA